MQLKKLLIAGVSFMLGGYIVLSGIGANALTNITHVGYAENAPQQDWVRHARKVSGGNWKFMNTLEGESGFQSPTLQSKVRDDRSCIGDGKGYEDSHGFCQLNRCRHRDVTDDARFSDPYRQIEQCYAKYTAGTTFYGYKTGMFVTGGELQVNTNSYGPIEKATVKEKVADIVDEVEYRKSQEATAPIKECHFVKTIKNADYLQIDKGNGEFLSRHDIGGENGEDLKIFNCFGSKYYKE